MNAAPADQIRLLDLQALDSRLDQLAHRRRSLPEHAEIEKATADHTALRDLVVAAETQLGDTTREQTKAEQDVEQVRARAARNQQRLDSGAVTSPKDLENLQHEIGSLARRQSDLEDVVLDVMERMESAQTRVTELTARLEHATVVLEEAVARRDAAFAEIDADAAKVARDREAVAAVIPADLMKLYTRLREQQGGVGAARLHQRRCEGCHVEFSTADLNAVKAEPADAVVRCENCGRILVRTSDSGI
ncbi:C4-type zinc ribbon domain-containing protein [Streptacidiphilus sp. ASG 303]|uniref:zinc ribbon domain-containing protein n=1 Tax=Streptacidiphilus sp. ASG 303 TaxID=2896847 RepID=UPI001E2EB396|nr:C4-type zinc ribbon domain-containing protein [Streptacidiphilus sp. ASG 303]MCD0482510.1 C4-type zinc ribbon domain-containing protein [Streptacidiphilus sp. ASG 303]